MGVADEYPSLDQLLTRLVALFKSLKRDLQDDGRLDIDEIVDAIPFEKGKEEIRELLDVIKGLYPEIGKLSGLSPFKMLTVFGPYISRRLMGMFE